MVELGEWILGHYQKVLLVGLVLSGVYYALTRPYSLGDPATYVTLIVGQLLFAAVFHYRRVFFGAVMASFLGAGLNLPLMGGWVAARWPILLVAAMVGLVLWLKEERQHFGAMHFVALACAVAALTSATVSAFPRIAFLKASSLLLLLLYASGGVRIAILNCEHDFVRRLVDVAEIIGYLTAACHFGLHVEIFGNPNSLGAVAGAALVPLAMWAVWVADTPNLRRRRLISLAVSVVLLVTSRSRAGLLSSALTAAFFLLSLRRYRFFLRAATLCVAVVSVIGLWNPDLIWRTSEDINSNLVYKGHREKGLLGSRMQPWNDTMETIRGHPLLGGGFGTTATGADTDAGASAFTTSFGTTREHGNSYLALLEWVGLLGILPFLFLIGGILLEIKTVGLYMRRTLDGSHPAVPLAMVCLAGLVAAAFEDWLFAVGYYLSVFFWSMAFCLVDLTRHPIEPEPVSMPMATRHSWLGGGTGLLPHQAGRR